MVFQRETLERCLACEAVVSRADNAEGPLVGNALACGDVRRRALSEIR